ncbi:MAG: hypothetical protein WC006_00770 [Bacilli bacterium]
MASELGDSWIKLLIAWTPMIALLVPTFALYRYHKLQNINSKRKGILLWVMAFFVNIVFLGAGMGLLISFWLEGDFVLASQIMQDYWAGTLGLA